MNKTHYVYANKPNAVHSITYFGEKQCKKVVFSNNSKIR